MAKQETSSCMSLTVAARRVYEFKIEDCSFTKWKTSSSKYFQSDTFSFGGYDWAVRFSSSYPSFDVSLYLVCLSKLKSGGHRVGVSFACTLLEKSGKPSATVEKKVCSEFSSCGQQVGFYSFMGEEDFQKHLQRDCVTVRCTISVLRKPVEK
ncbi:unnamed protein product [Alopecurus aequalis]